VKAIVQDRYGPPETLALTDVERPSPGSHELLVRVRATSVNAADWHVLRGDPYVARLAFGLRRPRARIRGRDVAGVVEDVGDGVTRFKPGDEVCGVLGMAEGAFAEYVCAPEDRMTAKPVGLTFEQAGALPLAGFTALQGLRDDAGLRAGQRLLVNGASGGVGTFAVQIGKDLGAEVTAVCSTRNVDLLRSLGADAVVDYTREDFTRSATRYDVVLDLVGNRSLRELRSVLTPTGTLLLSGGGVSGRVTLIGPMRLIAAGRLRNPFTRQRILSLTGRLTPELLAALAELADAGRITPAVDRTYPLSEVPDAIRYLEQDHARAKVVVTV